VESERIVVAVDGGVAHVELVREAKLNAMDGAFFSELGKTFRRLGTEGEVRAILLSGRGKHFTAGLDLDYAAGQFAPRRIRAAAPKQGCGISSGCRMLSPRWPSAASR
jgi:enoyl-CoA hydratase/carnithine racemase